MDINVARHLNSNSSELREKPAGVLRVPFAKCSDGIVRHIGEINNHTYSPFSCAECGGEVKLRAIESIHVAKHFYHKTTNQCNGETSLHLFAKRVIAEHKHLFMPQLKIGSGYYESLIREQELKEFDRVEIEANLGSRRIDAICYLDESAYSVEFAVYHKVDSDKKIDLERSGIPAIEIDLGNPNRTPEDVKELIDFILIKSKRRWIYHPEVKIHVDKTIARERLAKIELAQALEKLKSDLNQLISELRGRRSPSPSGKVSIEKVEKLGLSRFIGIEAKGGYLLRVDHREWQSLVLSKVVLDDDQRFMKLSGGDWMSVFTPFTIDLPEWMFHNTLLNFRRKNLKEFSQIAQLIPHPAEMAHQYLMEVSKVCRDIQQTTPNSRVIISGNLAKIKDRFVWSKNKVLDLLRTSKAPGDHWQTWKLWQNHKVFEEVSIFDLIVGGGVGYKKICNNLNAYAQMVLPKANWSVYPSFMGLPLHGLHELHIDNMAHDDRYNKRFDPITPASYPTNENRARLEIVQRNSGLGMNKAVREIKNRTLLRSPQDHLNTRSKDVLHVDESRAVAKQKLRDAALEAFGSADGAERWLTSPNSMLNHRTPIECVSHSSLIAITALLIGL